MAPIRTSLFMQLKSINFPSNPLSFLLAVFADTGTQSFFPVEALVQGQGPAGGINGGNVTLHGGPVSGGGGDQYSTTSFITQKSLVAAGQPLPTSTRVFIFPGFPIGTNWSGFVAVYRKMDPNFVLPDPRDPAWFITVITRPEIIGDSFSPNHQSPDGQAIVDFTLPKTGNATFAWS